MLRNVLVALGHFSLVSMVLLTVAAAIGISQHASINFGDAPLAYKVGGEGPHVFFEGDNLEVNYIRGNRSDGFEVERQIYPEGAPITVQAYFALDGTTFSFDIQPIPERTAAVYEDDAPIMVVSDLEGNFASFRDFLLENDVIAEDLSWNFAKGHLVLLGDMVDRGFSTTQLLWFIYKLENEAKAAGGVVHYIIGNHEVKNLQGNFKSAADKYIPIAGFFGKSRSDLFGQDAFLGRWLATKNAIEKINGHLFVHGGLHPQLAREEVSIAKINDTVRKYYRQMYYPGLVDGIDDLVISTKTGPAWYRGNLKGNASFENLRDTLDFYGAKSLTVGHTLQFKVNSRMNGTLFAVDVKHPNDYRKSFPLPSSEGLLIENEQFLRVLDDGEQLLLD